MLADIEPTDAPKPWELAAVHGIALAVRAGASGLDRTYHLPVVLAAEPAHDVQRALPLLRTRPQY